MDRLESHYFDALHEAAKAINSTLKSDEILSIIVRTATEATKAKGCSLLLLDDEKKFLVHKTTFGLSDRYLEKGVLLADLSLGDVKGGSAVVADVSNDLRVQYPADAVQEGIASIIGVPLNQKGVIIGVLRVYFAQKQDAVPIETIKLLTAIANLSAIAMQNSSMYESLKKAHEVCQRELWHFQP